jgi:hypothetical protein
MEARKVTLNISQVQTIVYLLGKQIEETENILKEEPGNKYESRLLETYKDALVKFHYISAAQFGLQLVESEESQNIDKKYIEAGEMTESERITENEEYFQYLKKIHG